MGGFLRVSMAATSKDRCVRKRGASMKTEILKNDFLRRRLLSDSVSVWSSAEDSKIGLEASTRTSTKSTVQSVDVRRADVRAGKIITGFVVLPMLIAAMLAAPVKSSARMTIGVTVSFGPPALPYYMQPPCPGPGYIWTPGYWAWDPAYGYFWVPGTWVMPPFVGALWTPGYWDYDDGAYVWNAGYWGPAVGFYGDIDYGYGYTGDGYQGGYWNRGTFYYNRTVNNITTVNITNVYNQPVNEHFRDRHISYHGGPGGTSGQPTRTELIAARERRSDAVSAQQRQLQMAEANPAERASVNHGRPAIAATRRPGAFKGSDAVPARSAGGPYREPPHSAMRGGTMERPAPAGNASPHPSAAPNPQPARRAPERPRMHEQPPPRGNPHDAKPERRVPNGAQPREVRPRENHARQAPPPNHTRRTPPPRREKQGPRAKNGGGHGHGG